MHKITETFKNKCNCYCFTVKLASRFTNSSYFVHFFSNVSDDLKILVNTNNCKTYTYFQCKKCLNDIKVYFDPDTFYCSNKGWQPSKIVVADEFGRNMYRLRNYSTAFGEIIQVVKDIFEALRLIFQKIYRVVWRL